MATPAEWIEAYVASHGGALLGRCREAVEDMRRVFPELREVRGHVWVPGWGKRGHAWLVDAAGEIVDPTAGQFPAIDSYEPWAPGDEVYVGRCRNCGFGIWLAVDSLDGEPPRPSFCCDECEDAAITELRGELRR